ncbi:Uncharacterized protein TCM_032775 [Theobroma cacao]|uniref:Integrase zinc-binding domain-containing protein n=1 Tax=Theobroma cacao TaxID=3641 RepID=A0A061FHI4_THECC|nr:Uncharacterized protein TCM_032775 [Theobroma cacao]
MWLDEEVLSDQTYSVDSERQADDCDHYDDIDVERDVVPTVDSHVNEQDVKPQHKSLLTNPIVMARVRMASKYRACLYVDLVQHYRDEKNMMSIPYEEFKKDERARSYVKILGCKARTNRRGVSVDTHYPECQPETPQGLISVSHFPFIRDTLAEGYPKLSPPRLIKSYREVNSKVIPRELPYSPLQSRIPKERKGKMLTKGTDGVLRYGTRLYVPNNDGLRRKILEEAHMATYVVHLGATKMYQDLKKVYWLEGLKKDVAEFISKFLVCQQVKVQHRRPASLLQPLPVLE